MVYRGDIQGLRGVSVVAVILFHLGLGLPGGFVGVDVFFVISGFLMTGLIADEFARRGTLSFADFYARRIRRIFPALLVMILATIALAYFVLLPGDYKELAESGSYAALSLGNVFFFLTTGYFDSPAEAKGLLHTWSLGVEEQFYLVWPAVMFVLLALAKSRRAAMLALLLAIVGLGFLVSVYGVLANPKAAFYLLHARIWELAAGGLLVFVPPSFPRARAAPAVGLAMILGSLFVLSPASPFPGWNALPAVLGAALIVNPASASSSIARVLSRQPLIFLGQISYSLYLWHWPLIVFWRQYRSGAALTLLDTVIVASAAVLVAWASWKWVEQPFRKPRAAKATVPLGLTAAAVVAALGFIVVAADGFPGRITPRLLALASLNTMWDWSCPHAPGPFGTECVVGVAWETAAGKGVIWGDSHAEHLLPLLDLAGRKSGRAIALFGDCPAIYYDQGLKRDVAGYPNYDTACSAQRARYIDLIKSSPEIEFVFLAARWSAYLAATYRNEDDARSVARGLQLLKEGLEEIVVELAPLRRRIILIGEMPQLGFDPIPCVILESIYADNIHLWRDPRERARCRALTASIPRPDFLERLAATNAVLKSVADSHPGVLAFFPTDRMCETDCITYLGAEFLFRDGNHLRRNLSPEATDEFATLIGLTDLLRGLGGHARGARPHDPPI
ncbi:MAG TPA: acyltransferase family protein [Xanthobacteraceae bacterium]